MAGSKDSHVGFNGPLNRSQDMALELPALCSDFFGGKWEEPGDAIQVTWGIRGFPVKSTGPVVLNNTYRKILT